MATAVPVVERVEAAFKDEEIAARFNDTLKVGIQDVLNHIWASYFRVRNTEALETKFAKVAEFINGVDGDMVGGDNVITKTEIKYIVMSYVRSGDWQTTVAPLAAAWTQCQLARYDAQITKNPRMPIERQKVLRQQHLDSAATFETLVRALRVELAAKPGSIEQIPEWVTWPSLLADAIQSLREEKAAGDFGQVGGKATEISAMVWAKRHFHGCDVIAGALLETPGKKKPSIGVKAEVDGLVLRDIMRPVRDIMRPVPASVEAPRGGDAGGLYTRVHVAHVDLGDLSDEVEALAERQRALQARCAKLSGWPKGGGTRKSAVAQPTKVLAALVEAKFSASDLYADLKKCDMLIAELQAADGSTARFSTMALKKAKKPSFQVAVPAADPASGAAQFGLHYYVRSSAPVGDLGELYHPSLRKRFRGNAFKQVFGVPPDTPPAPDLSSLIIPIGFDEVGSEALPDGAEGRYFEVKVSAELQEKAVAHARATLEDVVRRIDTGLLTYWMER